ncbi:NF038120 family PEP-CTERM protein [Duganella callida]|uniref:PEP-CTERM sorting domain-containing protein n=1 Tax=Duganella callida TaxID=2561932 RepID=A0A4Y9RQV6_9BURK|nr:NF038120 family PEP-CTERM protein [Duganella callida]TFW11667.1 PEP-CTERM sorting domain-containing protein [Duganella callida]
MKKLQMCVNAALFATGVYMVGAAHADTVTFEDVPIYSNEKDFSSGAFNFSSPEFIGYVADGAYCDPACPYNGTNVFVAGNSPAALTMTYAGGGAFDFKKFDGGGGFNFNLSSDPEFAAFIPTKIDVVGRRADGQTVYQSFLIDRSSNADGRLNLTSFSAGGSFTNLVSITFSASGSSDEAFNSFTLDNIIAVPVPEPSEYAMLLAGVAFIAGLRRRRSGK